MIAFARTLVAIVGASFTGSVGALVRTKVLASFLSAASFGVFGLFVSLLAALSTVLLIGLGPALTRLIAARRSAGGREDVIRVTYIAGAATASVGVIAGSLIGLSAGWLAGPLLGDVRYTHLVVALGVALPFAMMGALFTFALQGLQASRAYAVVSVLVAVVSLGTVVPGVLLFGLDGAVFGSVLAAVLSAFLYLGAFLNLALRLPGRGASLVDARKSSSRAILGELLAVSLPSFAATVLGGGAPYLVRLVVGHTLGLESAGILHAALSIVSSSLSVLTNAVSWHFFPRMSEVAQTPALLADLQNRAFRLGAGLMVPAAAIAIAAREPIVAALLSPSLADAGRLLPPLVVGEFVYLAYWAILVSLLTAARAAPFVLLEVSRVASLLCLAWAAGAALGLWAVSWAFPGAAAIALGLGVAYQRRRGTGFSKANLGFIAAASGLLATLAATAPVMEMWVFAEATLGVILLTGAMSIDWASRIRKNPGL
jgi:O-antigen/teichoic acid export membrane protein